MLNALAWVGARLWLAYARLCFWTSRVSLGASAEGCLAQVREDGVPAVFTFWQDELFLTSFVSLCPAARLPVLSTPDGVCGRVLAMAWRALGMGAAVYPRRSTREQRLMLLERPLREVGAVALAADQGRPRFAVRAAPWQLASRAGGAALVAMHVRSSATVTLFGARLPLPFGAFTVEMAGPMCAQGPLEDARRALTQALDELRQPGWHPPSPHLQLISEPPAPAPPASPAPAAPQTVAVGAHRRSYGYAQRSERTQSSA